MYVILSPHIAVLITLTEHKINTLDPLFLVMRSMTISSILLLCWLFVNTYAFHFPMVVVAMRQQHRERFVMRAEAQSMDLLEAVQAAVEPKNETKILPLIEHLEMTNDNNDNYDDNDDEDEDRFKPLIGLYDVSYIKTKNPKENPVGGKWTRKNGNAQRILKTRRTFQHILPVNTTGLSSSCHAATKEATRAGAAVGEAVNVVSLEAFGGLMRLTVILRGDAVPLTLEERTNTSRVVQPLSSRAVKALFDAPRIVIGKTGRFLNINVGPTSSVLLDTTYCDDNLRIGMGGTSGTRFVFSRCANDDVEANEFRALLQQKPTPKKKALLFLAIIASSGMYGAIAKELRVIGSAFCLISVLMGALIATSSGGIEQNDRSVQFRKEEEATKTAAATS